MRKIIATILPRRKVHLWVSLTLATILMFLLVLQLFSYDKLLEPYTQSLPETLRPFAMIFMALTVVAELCAIAYLLPVGLSKLARGIGAVCTITIPLFWMWLTWQSMRSLASQSVIFGLKFHITPSLWQGIFMAFFFVVTLWLVIQDYSLERDT